MGFKRLPMSPMRMVRIMKSLVTVNVILCGLTEHGENFWFMMLVHISMDVIILHSISRCYGSNQSCTELGFHLIIIFIRTNAHISL